MRAFLSLRVLCILIFQSWVQGYPVRTECSLLNLVVFVKRDLFGDGVPVRAGDLTLGDGCPINNVLGYDFQFQYLVRECGIETMVFATRLVFNTVVHYNPAPPYVMEFYHSRTEFYISCMVSRIVSPQYSLMAPGEKPQSGDTGNQAPMREAIFSTPEFRFLSFN